MNNYITFENDPTGLRLYTLENGLKVYLSKNTDEPKIETLIAVKAGSTYDPADQTGLAHYLEHMMFKGTSKFGTINWEKEKELLDAISGLYEKHKLASTNEEKRVIYKKIDSVSFEASKYAIANEYDKMISSIGAEGTNAFTSNEMTVYKNKIPSNELEKWLAVEKERFRELVLRLFHTELETVYEEFNRGQDEDGRKHYQELLEGIFPTHPYGTQSTIGESEHLKTPSMVSIHTYFEKYYVPNNMAIILVGDIDFDETIAKVSKAFGSYKNRPVTHPKFKTEIPLNKVVRKEVFGPSEESIYIGFRGPCIDDESNLKITLIDYLLTNSKAGLIDLNLNAKQKVQTASSQTITKKDYSIHLLSGKPKGGQSLKEVESLLLSQLDLIKKGEFEEWLLEAVLNDMELSLIKKYENTSSIAYEYMYSFIFDNSWQNSLNELSKMRKITKAELVSFANSFYKDNYVVVNKLTGKNPEQVKVENPKITPVSLNRNETSDFVKAFTEIHSQEIKLKKVDYKSEIKKLNNSFVSDFSYIENKTNDFSSLSFIFPVGGNHDKKLNLACTYISYLGTSSVSNEEIKKAFYKLGISYSISVLEDETRISISGLQQNLEKGVSLFFNYLNDLKVDQLAYDELISRIEKSRANAAKNKGGILWKGLLNYGKYREDSSLRNIDKLQDLKEYDPKKSIALLQSLLRIEPKVFYYGKEAKNISNSIVKTYPKRDFEKTWEVVNIFNEVENTGNIYFANFDMVQVEMVLVSKEDLFSQDLIPSSLLFNAYFGSGLSSIVFQEIRESKSLAYSAMSRYALATKKEKPNYLLAYIGTQANKLAEAIVAMKALLNEMPLNEVQFNAAKESVLKSLASERITKDNVYWSYQKLLKRGIDKDIRKEIYDKVANMSLDDLNNFFNAYVKDRKYDMLILGNKKDLDLEILKEQGAIKELEIDYLFNF